MSSEVSRVVKRPTQADVARLAGVSRATVSNVFNGRAGDQVPITDETRRRVEAAIAELGYEPDARAQSLRRGGTRTFGLLIPDTRNPHYWQIVSGIEREAKALGYDILLTDTALDRDREIHSLKALSRRRVDGLIVNLTYSNESTELLAELAKRRLPVVVLGGFGSEIDSVGPNFGEGMAALMDHLLDLGHRRIGFIFGVGGPEHGGERYRHYREALLGAGLPVDEQLIDVCGTDIEDGYRAAGRLLQIEQAPTALVAVNDLLAIGARRAAAERGLRVPEDLSLVGFDDIPMARYLTPPLTTVRIDAEEVGRQAVRVLIERLNDPEREVQQVIIPAHLELRESTAQAREAVPTQEVPT